MLETVGVPITPCSRRTWGCVCTCKIKLLLCVRMWYSFGILDCNTGVLHCCLAAVCCTHPSGMDTGGGAGRGNPSPSAAVTPSSAFSISIFILLEKYHVITLSRTSFCCEFWVSLESNSGLNCVLCTSVAKPVFKRTCVTVLPPAVSPRQRGGRDWARLTINTSN